eukprot:g8425.t1
MARAREQLDFCSITGHAFWPDMPTDWERYGEIIDYHNEGFSRLAGNWDRLITAQAAATEPGRFLAFPSYEWHSLKYGDHNVYAAGPELPLRDAADLPELRRIAQESQAIVIPHHIGYAAGYRGIDWSHFHDECSPFVEIFSLHCCSESDWAPYPMLHDMGPRDAGSTAEAGWEAGHRFGVIASTDHHGGYPGSHGDGRVAVLAEKLTREAIWEAMCARRVYAVTGDKIEAQLTVDDAPIGSSIRSDGDRRLNVRVRGSDAIDRVEVLKNGRILRRLYPDVTSANQEANTYRLRLTWGYGLPLGLYIHERNGRVPDSARVMTPDHIRKVTARLLARVGINIGSGDAGPATIGPPIHFIGKSITGRDDDNRTRQVENSKGFLAAKELVYDAIMRRATDIHLEPKDDELSVRLRIDGVMYPTEPFDRTIGDSVCNIFKVLCAMDITQRRKAQDGSFRAKLEDREIDFRTATQGTRHGEKLSVRILDQSNSVGTLAELGFRKQLLEKLQECISLPHGLLLSCGPTGAGKSTTLYAALKGIDSYQRNIITVEDPIEYKIENVNQIEINPKAGQTFSTSLRNILRQDPDVLMIGEIRDKETADLACQAANTGHMVFSTIHANDTITALFRLLELGVEPFMAANSVTAILGQRLLRRLCRDCREAYRPSNKMLEEAGLPPDKVDKLYRPPSNPQSICSTCGGLGYRGRTGVFEFLDITERLRELIRDKANMTEIRTEARNHGMLYMQEEGLRLVALGTTSMDELVRVVK